MSKLTFDDIATHAIIEGFAGGLDSFIEELDTTLRNDILIQESGGIDNLIEESMTPSFEELANKIANAIR